MEKQIAGADYDGSLFESLDLFPIKAKLVHKTRGLGWDADRAEQALSLYKKWLYLHAEHPDRKLTPSADVDQVWHMHILDTRKYKRDCHLLFGGKFLQHNPYAGWESAEAERKHQSNYAFTNELFLSHFGETMDGADGLCMSGYCDGDISNDTPDMIWRPSPAAL